MWDLTQLPSRTASARSHMQTQRMVYKYRRNEEEKSRPTAVSKSPSLQISMKPSTALSTLVIVVAASARRLTVYNNCPFTIW